jgi:D-alanyl-D-alanine carboxypeptidase/D-alanyl-D-alanine-endopeptidase (penicillin-binding protein 4)
MPRISTSFALFLVLSALHAQLLIPIAVADFIKTASRLNPPTPVPSPPLARGERVREWGDSKPAAFENFAQATGISAEIDALLNVEWLRYGYCGVVVRDLQTGETLYTRDAERVLIPASNMKLLVSAAALHQLGPDYRFRTRVWMRGTLLPDGTLQGDLILQGLGDATLEMRGLETLAQQVRQAGVQRVQGYLLYDDSWLDAERYGFGWSSDDEPFGYQAQMSALCAERNAVRLYAKPATQVGEPAQLRLEPATDYVELVNRTRTVERGAANTGVRATRTRARNQIIVEGTIPMGSEEVFVGRYSVENPSRYAAHLFRQALQTAGVVVERGIVPNLWEIEDPLLEVPPASRGNQASHSTVPLAKRGEPAGGGRFALSVPLAKRGEPAGGGQAEAPLPHAIPAVWKRGDTGVTLLAEHLSPPLREVVALINKPSDNLITEITLKTLGKEVRGEGTTAAGVQVLREFLQSAGLEMGAVHIVDGSGLSRINGVSAENFVRLLEYMHRSPHAEVFRESLPVYGVDGTLRNRLRGTPVQGNGYAKTGSLNRVSSLSGYLRTKSGRWLAFSIIMNAYNAPASDARALQDKLVQLLWERL